MATVNPYSTTDDGRVIFSGHLYWHEGMDNWEPFNGTINVPNNTDIYILVTWINNTDHNIKGHAKLSVEYPDGTTTELTATQNQDTESSPRNGWMVVFEPFRTTSGEHKLYTKTYVTGCPIKVIVEVKNTGAAGDFTVGCTTGTGIGGSGCDLWITGKIQDITAQTVHLNVNETKTLTFNLDPTLYTPGTVYAVTKIYVGDFGDCLDGASATYSF